MQLIQLGAQLLSEKLGLDVDTDTISAALSSLLDDGKGGIDFAGLAAKMASSGELRSVVSSWLGDGGNADISAASITDLLGGDKVADFAGKIGTNSGAAADGLADLLPQLMDKASSGGSLLDSVGGVGGLMGMASKLFK